MTESTIEFDCIEVRQPIGTFYIGVMNASDLVAVAYADIRRIEKRDVESLIGIQRPLSSSRVKELKRYVNTVDATFPTSVILAVEGKHAHYDPKRHVMRVDRSENIAKIIDGQHRIAGLEEFKNGEFHLSVTIFIDMDIEDQAQVFATINLKQTKVSKSLAYDLYEFATSGSPQKTCHNIAKLLNSRATSPFYEMIKILGVATGRPLETLTQATFVDRLIRFISSKPMDDRDDLKRGKKISPPDLVRQPRLVFRSLFIQEKDATIARIVWNYFSAVRDKWPQAWSQKQAGNILNRTTGFGALMRLLPSAYRAHANAGKDRVVKTSEFADDFARVKLKESDFSPERFKPGSSGEGDLYRLLLSRTQLHEI